jgi:hypothetical protein
MSLLELSMQAMINDCTTRRNLQLLLRVHLRGLWSRCSLDFLSHVGVLDGYMMPVEVFQMRYISMNREEKSKILSVSTLLLISR